MDEEFTRTLQAAAPYARTLGITADEATPQRVVLRGAWSAERCTMAGVLHGGFLMTLADMAVATLAFLNLPDGATVTTTIEAKTNFLAAVRGGEVTATATPVHVGRRIVVAQADIHDATGRLASRTLQTQAMLEA